MQVQEIPFHDEFVKIKDEVKARNTAIEGKDLPKWAREKDGVLWQKEMLKTLKEVNSLLHRLSECKPENLQEYTEFAKAVSILDQNAGKMHEISHRRGAFAKFVDWILRRKPEPFAGIYIGDLNLFRDTLLITRETTFLKQLQEQKYLEEGDPKIIMEERVQPLGEKAHGRAFFKKTKRLHEYQYFIVEYGQTRSGFVTISPVGINSQGATRVFTTFSELTDKLLILGSLQMKEAQQCELRKKELESQIPQQAQDIQQDFQVLQDAGKGLTAFAVQKEGDTFYLWRGVGNKTAITIVPPGVLQVEGKQYATWETLKTELRLGEPLEVVARRVQNEKALEQRQKLESQIPQQAQDIQQDFQVLQDARKGLAAFAVQKEENTFYLWRGVGNKTAITIVPPGVLQVEGGQYATWETLKTELRLGEPLEVVARRVQNEKALEQLQMNPESLPRHLQNAKAAGKQVFALLKEGDAYRLYTSPGKSFPVTQVASGEIEVGQKRYADVAALKQEFGNSLPDVLYEISVNDIQKDLLSEKETAQQNFDQMKQSKFYAKLSVGLYAVSKKQENVYQLWKMDDKQPLEIDLKPSGEFKIGNTIYPNWQDLKKALHLQMSAGQAVQFLAGLEARERKLAEAYITELKKYCGEVNEQRGALDLARTELLARSRILKDQALGMSRWVKSARQDYLCIVEKTGNTQVVNQYPLIFSPGEITVNVAGAGNPPIPIPIQEFAPAHKMLTQVAAGGIEKSFTESCKTIQAAQETLQKGYPYENLQQRAVEKQLKEAANYLGKDGAFIFWKSANKGPLNFSRVHGKDIEHYMVDFEAKPGEYTLKSLKGDELKGQKATIADLTAGLQVDWKQQLAWVKMTREALCAFGGNKADAKGFEELRKYFETNTPQGIARPDIGAYIIYPAAASKLNLQVIEKDGKLHQYVIDLARESHAYWIREKRYAKIPEPGEMGGMKKDFGLRLLMNDLEFIKSLRDERARHVLSEPNFSPSVGDSKLEAARELSDLISPYKEFIQGAWLVRASGDDEAAILKDLIIVISKAQAGIVQLWLRVFQNWMRRWYIGTPPEKFTISILRQTIGGPISENISLSIPFEGEPSFMYGGKGYQTLDAVVAEIRQEKGAEQENWASLAMLQSFGPKLETLKDGKMKIEIQKNDALNSSQMSKQEAEDELTRMWSVLNKPVHMFYPWPANEQKPPLSEATMTKPRLGTYLFSYVDAQSGLHTSCLDIVCNMPLEKNKDGILEPTMKGVEWTLIPLTAGQKMVAASFEGLIEQLGLKKEEAWSIQHKKLGQAKAKLLEKELEPFEDLEEPILSDDAIDILWLESIAAECKKENVPIITLQEFGDIAKKPQRLARGFFIAADPTRFGLQAKAQEIQTPVETIKKNFSKFSMFEQYQIVKMAVDGNALPINLRKESEKNSPVQEALFDAFVKNYHSLDPRKEVEKEQLKKYLNKKASEKDKFASRMQERLQHGT